MVYLLIPLFPLLASITIALAGSWLGEESRRGLIRFLNAEKYAKIKSRSQAEDMCSLYLDHIESNLCGNYRNGKRQQLYDYIICWMASALTRHLEDRTTVGLVASL